MGVEARVVLEERSAPSEPPAGAWTDSAIPAQLLVPWTARAAGPVEHLTVAGSVNVARIGHIDCGTQTRAAIFGPRRLLVGRADRIPRAASSRRPDGRCLR